MKYVKLAREILAVKPRHGKKDNLKMNIEEKIEEMLSNILNDNSNIITESLKKDLKHAPSELKDGYYKISDGLNQLFI
jgi:hypothetical protein